ncbi:hypothetical protein BVC80_7265g5 [Macleaya cordata]|uniref:Transposase-associated domain-containing protein n=1 Tax=Macleaya cordata TaxID=56857 RepID=A0A200PMF0_MACCD|nr:hypothetical protein BVC80_7265g5 [Macleaya cordata]
MMDKAWVYLPRASSEYQQGAKNFIDTAIKNLKKRKEKENLNEPIEISCPCIDCRNTADLHPGSIVYEHLVRRGMDLLTLLGFFMEKTLALLHKYIKVLKCLIHIRCM